MGRGTDGTGGAPSLGHYVTVQHRGAPEGDVYVSVGQDALTVLLHPMVRSRHPQPPVGSVVECSSAVGRWSSRVRTSRDGVLGLAVPRWVARGVQRQTVRVPAGYDVQLRLSSGASADGRLSDLSVGGAAVMVERIDGLVPGASGHVVLPSGPVPVLVRSVRAHEHPLLAVVGTAWAGLDPSARRWIATEVSTGRISRRARVTG